MISTCHHPWCGAQQGSSRCKKIGLPGIPAESPGTAGAGGQTGRAWALAILIIAHMNHQIRLKSCSRFSDGGKGPFGGIIAGLKIIAFGFEAAEEELNKLLDNQEEATKQT